MTIVGGRASKRSQRTDGLAELLVGAVRADGDLAPRGLLQHDADHLARPAFPHERNREKRLALCSFRS